MTRNRPSGFTPEHIANFHRTQQIRRDLLKKMGDILEVWRDCTDKACQRGRSCKRSDASCLHGFMRALPDQDRRLAGYMIQNGAAGLSPDAALAQAQARVAAEIAQDGA